MPYFPRIPLQARVLHADRTESVVQIWADAIVSPDRVELLLEFPLRTAGWSAWVGYSLGEGAAEDLASWRLLHRGPVGQGGRLELVLERAGEQPDWFRAERLRVVLTEPDAEERRAD
jgi:hypothetical protein